MALGALDARLSALEQIIIIIVVSGGWRPPGVGGPSVDPGPSDYTRLDALYRVIGGHIPKGDPFAADLTRLSITEVEDKILQVAGEVTRLQALQGELNARLGELRTEN